MAAVKTAELIALDANYLIAAVSSNPTVTRQLERWVGKGIAVQMSSIAWSEYLCGPLDEADVAKAKRILSGIEAFTDEDAELAGDLFNHTGRRTRSHIDCMIAAHAIRRNALLATLNFRAFAGFERFQLKLVREP